jgi:signal transduction histidine kinase
VRVKTPEPRIYVVSVIPIGLDDDVPTHSIWLLSDQTETHRRAAEQQKAESMRSLATLTAGIAHEIKNPLNSITIHAQLMARAAEDAAGQSGDPLMDRLRRSSHVVIEEIQRLNRIVDQFIKAVRPSRPDRRPTRLNELVESLAELVRPECAERRIELVLDLDPAIPIVSLDPEQIYQALLNIIRNAIEAIDKPEGHLEIRTHLRSDHVLVEVEDNGCGIPEENRLSIFEPYNTTKFNGAGLGLMVVFRIVTAHGGAIGLDSELGRGSVFRIALPLDEKPVRLLAGEAVTADFEDLAELEKSVEEA